MKAHDLARELLKCDNLEITASIDISSSAKNHSRRLFTDECFGVNNFRGDNGVITITFLAEPKDNFGKKI